MIPETVEKAANEYVRVLSQAGQKWSLHAMGDLAEDYERRKLVASLAALGNPFRAEDIEKEFGIEKLNGREAMIQLGRILTRSLVQDIDACLAPAEQETLAKCHFSMIDIGEINALCAHRDAFNNKLPGFVILLNQGLYFCLKLLMTAQIYEDMQGDLSQYRRSGQDVFAAACTLFLTERPDTLNAGAVFTGDEVVDGRIEAHVSLGSTLVMQFVMLHEVGHAHLGHGALLDRARLHALSVSGQPAPPEGQPAPPEGQAAFHEAELEADLFAWTALTRRADTELKNFANLYAIRLFFGFLSRLEHILGRNLSGDHPPPAERIKQLTKAFAADGLAEEQQDVFDRQDDVLDRWSRNVTVKAETG